MNLGTVAKMLGQAAAYGFGVGAALKGIDKLAGYVTKKVKNRKCAWSKGYNSGYGDAVTIANAQLDELKKQLQENNELLKKTIQMNEAAE